MRIIPSLLTSILLIAIFFFSCDSKRVYEMNQDLESNIWITGSSNSFHFEIPDNSRGYNLLLNLRNTSNYRYQNIYVQFQLRDSTERIIEQNLLSLQLFHPQTGAPFGSSGIGDIYDHQFPVLENYRFPSNGKYELSFQQMMRTDSLMEILSVGARIEFVNAN